MNEIKIAESGEEIRECYPVMFQLRPLLGEGEFCAQVKRQMANGGFQLVYLRDGDIKAVAGIRIAEWLAGGKSLEIEDLVATENDRSKGYGGKLFDWIVRYGKEQKCTQVRLVSRVKRFEAHRFYLNKRMIIEAHYFSMPL